MHDAQQRLCGGAIGFALLTVWRDQLQLYDFLVRLLGASLLSQFALEIRPIAPCVVAVRQRLQRVSHQAPPGLGTLLLHAADGLAVEGGRIFSSDTLRQKDAKAKRPTTGWAHHPKLGILLFILSVSPRAHELLRDILRR